MTEPKRWIDEGPPEAIARLLSAAAAERPTEPSLARTLAVVGAGVSASGTAAAAAAGAKAGATASGAMTGAASGGLLGAASGGALGASGVKATGLVVTSGLVKWGAVVTALAVTGVAGRVALERGHGTWADASRSAAIPSGAKGAAKASPDKGARPLSANSPPAGGEPQGPAETRASEGTQVSSPETAPSSTAQSPLPPPVNKHGTRATAASPSLADAVATDALHAAESHTAESPPGAVSRAAESPHAVESHVAQSHVAQSHVTQSRATESLHVAQSHVAESHAAQSPPVAESLPGVEAPADNEHLAEEVALVDRARGALARGDASGALSALDEYDARFSRRKFAPEALYLRMESLLRAGRPDAARAVADRLAKTYPTSPHAARARQVLGQTIP